MGVCAAEGLKNASRDDARPASRFAVEGAGSLGIPPRSLSVSWVNR
jgi:hypothetical protein